MKRIIKIVLNIIPRPLLIRLSYVFRIFSRIWYKGSRYTCNVCEKSFRKMLPYGYATVRENALCPSCLSLERHRVIWLYLQQQTNFFISNSRVLHVAPEQCFYDRFTKLNNIEYVTADLESPLAQYKCDIQQMPFNNNEFDFVFCNHVLEHVDNDLRAMSEILRVLKPGGIAFLLVPLDFNRKETFEDNSITDAKERHRIFGQYDHVRVYGQDYPERLKKVGFKIDEPNFLDIVTKADKAKYCLPQQEYMYAYKK